MAERRGKGTKVSISLFVRNSMICCSILWWRVNWKVHCISVNHYGYTSHHQPYQHGAAEVLRMEFYLLDSNLYCNFLCSWLEAHFNGPSSFSCLIASHRMNQFVNYNLLSGTAFDGQTNEISDAHSLEPLKWLHQAEAGDRFSITADDGNAW